MPHRNAEYDYANDATFLKRLTTSIVAKATAVLLEPLSVGHAQLSQKRWALASAVLASPGTYATRFAEAVIEYSGSAIGASVDFAYDGHAPVDPNNPTGPETTTIDNATNSGVADSGFDTAVAAVWSAIAGVLPTD